YQEEFNKYDLHIGQILLSADDMKDSARRTNTRNTIEVLLNKGIIPIINENDSVAIEELSYGDNDKLSGLVSILLFVDLLIILTDVKGLCDKNPNMYPEAKIISQVDKIDQKLEELVQDFDGGITFGGMKSKIDIIKRLTNIGIPAIISSYDEVSLKNILDGKEIGTYFLPQK
ncbi:MAG: glutamate 5-kinase, partial [Candidatus Lokiarchaeota archaeon]|nr:glutamate 5-kinase [Candidatus Lokiarchaeota archaeon]